VLSLVLTADARVPANVIVADNASSSYLPTQDILIALPLLEQVTMATMVC
jgi:hypothetical protein